MDQRTKSGIRNEPLTTCIYRKINRILRTEIDSNATALAFNGIHYKILTNGIPPAQLPAQTALCAFIRVDNCCITGLKIMAFLDLGIHNQVEVGIHITVAQDLVFCKGCKCTDQAGLSGSSLTTYDN